MLDDKDTVLLTALRVDGRTSYVKLGESVGLSADAVRVRVERLIANGTARLATLIDPAIFGFSTRVTVGVNVLGDPSGFVAWAREQGELIHLVRVAGRFSFLAEVLSVSPAAAHETVFEGIGAAPGVVGVEAWPVVNILKWREDTRQFGAKQAPDFSMRKRTSS
jgi:Lrp/AsnC family transcriptional regulator, regulator for asnA, asnC and gidA